MAIITSRAIQHNSSIATRRSDAPPPGREPGEITYGVERLAAFSDAVFAIVATLLVLDLKLPDPPEPASELSQELVENIPDFIGWLVSFLVLARFWTTHHDVVASMVRCRKSTIALNFAFLGTISLLPFEASLLGAYEFETPVAILVFSVGVGLSALLLGLFARHAAHDQRLLRDDPGDLRRHWRHHGRVIPVLAGVAVGLAFVSPLAAVGVWGVEAVVMLVIAIRQGRGNPLAAEPASGVLSAADDTSEEKRASAVQAD